MKPCYLVLLALAGTCVRAQSPFQLFRPGVQYLYENPEYSDNPYLIASQYYGVRVDSVGCYDLYGTLGAGDAGMPTICLYERPSPFGYSVCQTADSTVMNFDDNDPFVLYQSAEVGARWRAYGGGIGITAEVLSVDTALVFGLPDTVKTIAFFANDTSSIGEQVRISQRYGLLEAPRFYDFPFERSTLRLAGMSAPTVGVQLPNEAIYGLAAVGDSFQIETYNATLPPFGLNDRFERRFTTFTILEVDTTDSEVYRYRASGSFYDYEGGYQPTAIDTVFDFTAQRLPEELRGVQPGQAVPSVAGDSSSLSIVKAYLDDCGLLRVRLSTPVRFEEDGCGFDESEVDGGPGRVYTPGVPVWLDSIVALDGPYESILRYYRTADSQCGTLLDPTDIIISVRQFDPTFDAEFQVFPNPTSGQFNVVLPGTDSYQVRLYNLAGSQVQSEWIRGGSRQSLATDMLPAGSYFLVVFEGARAVGRRQVIVTP